MREITNVEGHLEWVKPRALKMAYELRSNQEIVATLNFRSSFGSFATGETANGCWTFKRIGFLQTRATIRACGSDAEIAAFRNNTWSGGGSLTLADRREFLLTTNLWQTKLEVQTAAGQVLLRLQTTGFWQNSASVDVTPVGRQMPEIAWMTLFAWYVIVMMQMDAGSGAGASTC
jgi:hypothetical protein